MAVSKPYHAAVRVVPLDQTLEQERAGPIVIEVIIRVQSDGRGEGEAGVPALVPLPATLTRREREVLRLLAEHRSNREIAEQLVLSVDTIKHHVRSILEKLRVPNRHQATEIARRAFQL
jgi:DNA-binding CsgD family transcriptional regulator